MAQAYEILSDDDKRHLYDTQGMAAFDRGSGGGMGEEIDLNDILQQMFGAGGPGRPGGPVVGRQKGRDEEKVYEVTLEELYKGKTAKFASTKNTICSHCNGTGGKEKAKPKQCAVCQGQGEWVNERLEYHSHDRPP